MSETIAKGKFVQFSYRVTDAMGAVTERSDEPVRYVHGEPNQLLPKLESALSGAGAGDEVTVDVPPDEIFGPYDPSLVFEETIELVPPKYREIGAEVQMKNDAGESKVFYVTKLTDTKLTLDGNHPYAGKALTFNVTVETVREATEQDRASIAAQAASGNPQLH